MTRHHHDTHAEAFDGEAARRYEERTTRLGWVYRAIARRIAPLLPEAGHLVDVGTGPGHLLLALARQRPDARLTGMDVAPEMVRLADVRVQDAGLSGRVEVVVADVAALPLPDRCADVVTATMTAHHWPDLTAGVAEIARVLRPAGLLVVIDRRGTGPALRVAFAAAMPDRTVRRDIVWLLGMPVYRRWTVGPASNA